MFEVEKPRRFHYEPRFYDPEKEKWEALKKKYAIQREREEALARQSEADAEAGGEQSSSEEKDLAYFEQRVRTLDARQRSASSGLTWRDLFRKREMPKFNYQPRFSGAAAAQSAPSPQATPDGAIADDGDVAQKYAMPKHRIKIRRRFDISDTDYMKPIPGTKIILYCFIVFLLLMLIFGS